MIFFFRKKRGVKPSKSSYYRDLLFWWIYTPLWFLAFYAIYELWEVSWAYKIIPYLILVFGTPDPRPLFRSYSKYKKDISKWSVEKEEI